MPSLLIAVGLAIIPAGQLAAQPPLGAPNEVWVDVPDTAYVGQEVAIDVYIANSNTLGAFDLGMKVVSTDAARWDWVYQPDLHLNVPPPYDSVMISLNNDSRFWGDNLEVPGFGWGERGESICAFAVGAVSFDVPDVPAGPLEKAYAIHLRPTSPGTIVVDSAEWPPASSQWYLLIAGTGAVYPAWNGPFCFTVVEPPIGDVDCDGRGNLGDAVYIINWIFKGGPEPCR
jgi:hypothetical protein